MSETNTAIAAELEEQYTKTVGELSGKIANLDNQLENLKFQQSNPELSTEQKSKLQEEFDQKLSQRIALANERAKYTTLLNRMISHKSPDIGY